MNLDAELKLPVLTHGDNKLTLSQVIGGSSLVPYSSFRAGRPAGAKERLVLAEQALRQYDARETACLGLARTEAQPEEMYHLLGGKSYTAAEVIQQIKENTPVGQHFAKLQKRAALLATQQSLARLSAPDS